MAIDYDQYKEASDIRNRQILDQMNIAIDAGVEAVGPAETLNAALLTQNKCCAEFFTIVSQTYHKCVERGIEPMLPLTQEVIDSFNNAAGSCQLVAQIMKRSAIKDDTT